MKDYFKSAESYVDDFSEEQNNKIGELVETVFKMMIDQKFSIKEARAFNCRLCSCGAGVRAIECLSQFQN